MVKREKLVTWLLAGILFLLVAANYQTWSFQSPVVYGHYRLWQMLGFNYTPVFLYMFFLFPVFYFLSKKFTDLKLLQNVLLISSFIIPTFFFLHFVGWSENLAWNFNYDYALFEGYTSPYESIWFEGLPASWFPTVLLVSVLVIFMALGSVLLDKLKMLSNHYLSHSAALSVAMLFFLFCALLGSGIYKSHLNRVTYELNDFCVAKTAQRWTPQYVEQVKAERLPRVEQELQEMLSGERPLPNNRPILDPEYAKFALLESELRFQFAKEHRACFWEAKEKINFARPEYVTSALFVPIGIACLLFSFKIFRRKGFANIVLEKGFLYAGAIMWVFGFSSIFFMFEFTQFTGYQLALFAFTLSLVALALFCYILGWRPKLPKLRK